MRDEENEEILRDFGEIFINKARDDVYVEFIKSISGEMKSKSSLEISEKLSIFSDSQMDLIKSVILSNLDNTLHHFLWMIEQHEEFDLVAYKDDKTVSLREISDGLSGELYREEGWIEKYSKFPPTLS